jgi:deoxyribodipyrimidine photo-lyase
LNPYTPFHPTREAALERIKAINPSAYARSRNDLRGAVTGLSPYITHGVVSSREIVQSVLCRHSLEVDHKLVMELGWREFFSHVWSFRGDEIFHSLHEGPLADSAYARDIPDDLRQARTGVPVIDQAVSTLYSTGYLHNHARMWLASYFVHFRKVHWRVAADWMYGHLLDGDLASNHLSWQWVAGTGSHKPYLFNAENVARYAPEDWHSPGTVVDQSYEALEAMAREARAVRGAPLQASLAAGVQEPPLFQRPPQMTEGDGSSGLLECITPQPARGAHRHVWLVHPWSLGPLPESLPDETWVVGVLLKEFHQSWPWSERRWAFVGPRMRELTSEIWWTDGPTLSAALQGAQSVGCSPSLHLEPLLSQWAQCPEPQSLFAPLRKRCDSFSKWWRVANQESPWNAQF